MRAFGRALFVASIAAVLAGPARAQDAPQWELGAFGGGFFGSRISLTPSEATLISSGATFGLRGAFETAPHFRLQASFSTADVRVLTRDPLTGARLAPDVPGHVRTYELDWLYGFGRGRLRGFAGLGAGAMTLPSLQTGATAGGNTRFTANIVLGGEYFLTERLAAVLEGRYRWTETGQRLGTIVCESKGCEPFLTNLFSSAEATAGFSYRFGDVRPFPAEPIGDVAADDGTHRYPGTAAAEVFLFELLPWAVNRYISEADYAYVTADSIKAGFRTGFTYDRDSISTNVFNHPIHGSFYYSAARSNTDRTLFFDLLPLDVGVIGGFKTRVQLYTVPGQVFYNTTRKLVLKGVDGMVFVADSQRAMKDANVESLANLRANLAEIGIKLDEIPLVFQYNKRDLANILSVEELEESLNPQRQHESYEACAVLGQGVFETLKAISRLTLRSLKKRMLGEEKPPPGKAAAAAAQAAPAPAAKVEPPAPPPAPPPALSRPVIAQETAEIEDTLEVEPGTFAGEPAPPTLAHELNQPPGTFDGGDSATVQEFEQALDSLDAPLPEQAAPPPPAAAAAPEAEIGDVTFAEAEEPEPEKAVDQEVRHVKVGSNIDILAELERLRKTSTATSPAADEKPRRAATGISVDDLLASSLNHRKEVSKVFEVQVPKRQLAQGHQVTIGLKFEDRQGNAIGEGQNFAIELQSRSDIEKLLLSLKFHIQGK